MKSTRRTGKIPEYQVDKPEVQVFKWEKGSFSNQMEFRKRSNSPKIKLLRDRAQMMQTARRFFAARSIMEVDVPLLRQSAPVDVHIDLIKASCCGKNAFLHSSPEYGMKKLLAEGSGDIYQLAHVFRDFEYGERHQPEFMLAEWYRLGFSLEQMIAETAAFIALFLDVTIVETLSYEEAFRKYSGCIPADVPDRDEHYALHIEPHLGKGGLTLLKGFLPEDAALAQTRMVGEKEIAMRFELLYKGMELANGYEELVDPEEQRRRLLDANEKRISLGKEPYPIDEDFLRALEKGIAPCSGVAVGFERLMMLRHDCQRIEEVLSLTW